MRIAFLVDAFPAPSETFVLNQIMSAVDRGHKVDIYACSGSAASRDGRIERYRFDERVRYVGAPRGALRRLHAGATTLVRAGWRAPALCTRALNVFRHRRDALTLRLLCAARPFLRDGPRDYDVIHCQFGPLGRLGLRLRQIGALRGALVTAFRGYDATKYLRRYPRAYDELFREGQLFLPVSEALKRVLIAHGADAARIEVHHSGIDCRNFSFQARARAADEPARVLSIGRLVEKKGVEFAIRAVARLIHAGCALRYDVIGEGELRAPLERLIAELGVQAHVRLLGWRRHGEVASLLGQAHILVAPSVTAADGDQEGIANVLKEAMATGMPVVATRHGGTGELVEEGVSGYLVPERDVAALADRLRALIDHPERWPAMGRAGRAKVEAAFDSRKLNEQLERLYERAVAARTPRADAARAWASAADKA